MFVCTARSLSLSKSLVLQLGLRCQGATAVAGGGGEQGGRERTIMNSSSRCSLFWLARTVSIGFQQLQLPPLHPVACRGGLRAILRLDLLGSGGIEGRE